MIPREIKALADEQAKRCGEIARRDSIIRELTRFITSYTPGGSEYVRRFSETLYVAELEACGRYIDNRIAEGHAAKQELARLNKRATPRCPGIEIEPGTFSGCDQSAGDCPVCGK